MHVPELHVALQRTVSLESSHYWQRDIAEALSLFVSESHTGIVQRRLPDLLPR